MQRMRAGFTLLELLVVIAIIGILAAIVYASFSDSRSSARDAQRKTDLKQLQLAIELYKSQNGQYPEQGCVNSGWSGRGPHSDSQMNPCDEWIVGLVPEYVDALPEDPSVEDQDNTGYVYQTNAERTAYKVLAHESVELNIVQDYDDRFARCPFSCGSTWCGASGPATNVYSVYSRGAECW